VAENLKAGVGFRDNDSQWTQFFSGALRFTVELDELLQSCFADSEAEFLEIPAFKAILFRALSRRSA
jgi:hypothetical protein